MTDAVVAPCGACGSQVDCVGIVLCLTCRSRLLDALSAVPRILDHLAVVARLEVGCQSLYSGRGGNPAERDILPAAWLAADELKALVDSWVLLVRDKMRKPPALADGGYRYLLRCREWIGYQDWAPDLLAELRREIGTCRARWPLPDDSESARELPIACPRGCGRNQVIYPPTYPGQPITIACDCGWICPEDAQDFLAQCYYAVKRSQTAA